VIAKQDKSVAMLLELARPRERRTCAELIDQALRTALVVLDSDAAVFLLPGSAGIERHVLHAGSATPAVLQVAPGGSEIARRLARKCEPILVTELTDDPAIAAADGCPGVEAGPVLFMPLPQRGLAIAYLAVYRRRGRARYTTHDHRVVLLFGAWLAIALDQIKVGGAGGKRAATGGGSTVFPHAFLKKALQRELRRASRHDQETSVVVIDLDPVSANGDGSRAALWRPVAAVLSAQVRSFDLLGRDRSDRFMMILPQTGRAEALLAVERMRAAVAASAIGGEPAGAVTLRVGMATFPHDASDVRGLTAVAERSLARGADAVDAPARKPGSAGRKAA
jgi:diguanylate cyclase (GGDEF)-like protein